MQTKISKKTFSGQTFYIGLDVHKKSWKVTILGQDFEHKTFSQHPDAEVLVNYLTRHFPGAHYKAVYESGFCGFTICRELINLGVECGVVHAADVPTNHRDKMQKTDLVDSRKLAKHLRSNDAEFIHLPDIELEGDRKLVRLRHSVSKDMTSTKIRVKSLLMQFGISIPERFTIGQTRSWSKNYLEWLKNVDMPSESTRFTLDMLLKRGKFQRDELLTLTRAIKLTCHKESYQEAYNLLISIPGLGLTTAAVFLLEFGDITRFKTLDQLCHFVGLVPRMHGSGERMQTGSLVNRGRKLLKIMLIETSWTAIRKDPALTSSFQDYSKRMNQNKAIIRIARKILSRIRYVLTAKQKYELGVVN